MPVLVTLDQIAQFNLNGLPPGTYTIAAVHEKYGEQEMKVTLGPTDDKQDADFSLRP